MISRIKISLVKFCQAILSRRAYLWIYVFLKRGKLKVGPETFIHKSVQIIGRKNVAIGTNTIISESSWLNVNHRENNNIAISIGDNCFIGRRNFFTSGKKIAIGDYCLTASDCKFIGSTHIASDPTQPYVSTGTTKSDSIYVGCNVFFAASTTVLGSLSIGCGSVIGAGALVRTDIPPFSLVVGSPGRVVKRYSYAKKLWISVKDLQPDDLLDNPSEAHYLSMLKKSHASLNLPILASGNDMGSL